MSMATKNKIADACIAILFVTCLAVYMAFAIRVL